MCSNNIDSKRQTIKYNIVLVNLEITINILKICIVCEQYFVFYEKLYTSTILLDL